jgi:hypothetical protein
VVERRRFGEAGLTVSVVGLGAGQIGEADVSEAAGAVLTGALDLGGDADRHRSGLWVERGANAVAPCGAVVSHCAE